MKTNIAGLVLPLALLLGACANSASHQVRSRIDRVGQEQTAVKLFERGRAFASVGDYTRAEQYLVGSLNAGAADTKVVPLLLHVCVEDRRFRVAVDYAREFLRHHPDNDHVRFILATLLVAVEDEKEATAQLKGLLTRQPDHAEAHFALAALLREQPEQRLVADAHYREYLRLCPQGPRAEEAKSSVLHEVP